MEDSTFEGWTSPPGAMDMPTGRRLDGPRKGILGTVTYGIEAHEESIAYAARHWPERKLKDFEIERRVWRDRATGEEYRVVPGNPLLSLGHGGGDQSVADCFVVANDLLWFLKSTSAPARSVVLGSIGAS